MVGLYHRIMNLTRLGARALFGGARVGNSGLAAIGAALLALKLLRKTARPKKQLLYSRTLKPGETLRIRLPGADEAIEMEG